MGQEVDRLAQIVTDMPEDVITRPGEGLGVYSIGYKHLSNIELLVRSARARHLGVGSGHVQQPGVACLMATNRFCPGLRRNQV